MGRTVMRRSSITEALMDDTAVEELGSFLGQQKSAEDRDPWAMEVASACSL